MKKNDILGFLSSRILLEHTAGDLEKTVDAGRKGRSKGMAAFYRGLTRAPGGDGRTMWRVPSATSKGKFYTQVIDIVVPIPGALFGLLLGKWDPKYFADTIKTADVRCSCNCPDFYWAGMAYNLGQFGPKKGTLAPKSGVRETNIAPDVKDPDRKNTLCKHLLAVMHVFPNNTFSIISDAKKLAKQSDAAGEFSQIKPGRFKMPGGGKSAPGVTESEVEPRSAPPELIEAVQGSLIKTMQDIENDKSAGAEELIATDNQELTEPVAAPESTPVEERDAPEAVVADLEETEPDVEATPQETEVDEDAEENRADAAAALIAEKNSNITVD